MARRKRRRQVTVEVKPMHRVKVWQIVNGTATRAHVHVAEHISVTMSREQGDGVAQLTLTGAPADKDGWRLTEASYTKRHIVRKVGEVTPAEELRAAAQKIRDIAGRATPGPWHCPGPDSLAPWTVYDREWSVASATAYSHDNPLGQSRGPGYVDSDANAEHIALWHPGVAKLVGAWLGCVAMGYDDGLEESPARAREVAAALMIARAINQGSKP